MGLHSGSAGYNGEMKVSKEGSVLKYWEPLELNPRHKNMIALKATGLSNNEIAQILGANAAHVSQIINHPDAKPLLAQLTTDHINSIVSDVGQAIQGSAMEMYEIVLNLARNAKKEEVRRDCAMDLLDRAGFTAKTVNAPPAVQFGAEGAEQLIRALRESKADVVLPREATGSALTVDAEWTHASE